MSNSSSSQGMYDKMSVQERVYHCEQWSKTSVGRGPLDKATSLALEIIAKEEKSRRRKSK